MCNKFTTGMIVGAVVGATMGMLVDPISDKAHKKLQKDSNNMFKNIGTAIDNIIGMW